MVSLKVPTVRMGPPPDPDHPQPHYPGVSATNFTPIGAMQAYQDVLWKDKLSRHLPQILGPKMQHNPALHADDTVGDVMPSKKSIASVYERLGFSFHPSTGIPVAPHVEQQQYPPARRRRQQSRSAEGPTNRGGATKGGPTRKGGEHVEPRSRSSLAAAAALSGAGRAASTLSASQPSLRYASAAAAGKDLDAGKQQSVLSRTAPSQLSAAPGGSGESQVETACSIWTLPPPASQLSKIEPPVLSRPLLRSVSEPYHDTVKVASDCHELQQIIFKKCRDKELAFL